MEDWEWAFFELFLESLNGRGGRKSANHRRVLDEIFLSARLRRIGEICPKILAGGAPFISRSIHEQRPACGLVERTAAGYQLSATGMELFEMLKPLGAWSEQWALTQMTDNNH